jgi:hypothetical protein
MDAVSCWNCRKPLEERDPIVFGNFRVPFCPDCWGRYDHQFRARFVLDYLDRQPGGIAWALARMAEAVTDRLEAPGSLEFPPGRN